MPGPLDGIKVVDVSAVVSGPLATMMLADQGAEVVKIEPHGLGDTLRLPNFARGGLSAFFANANRGKRSIVLDLGKPEGREVVKKLVADADVFVQNYRPGVVERLGIDYASLRAVKRDLIYASLSGFGESGPYAGRPVFDNVIQALSGMAAAPANPETGQPDMIRNIECDKATARMAADPKRVV